MTRVRFARGTLAGELAGPTSATLFLADAGLVQPKKVGATGGSYGGGLTWMTLTDPIWDSPGGVPMKLEHRKRQQKPKLVIICDISTSMRPVAGIPGACPRRRRRIASRSLRRPASACGLQDPGELPSPPRRGAH